MFKKFRRSRTALVGVSCALVGAAVVPVVGLATISGSTGDGPMVLQSGESSATYEAKTNVASITPNGYKQLWSRVGDTVQMSGVAVVNASASGATQIYVPLPVDSNVDAQIDCVGAGTSSPSTGAHVAVKAYGSDVAGHTHRCVLEWPSATTTDQWVHYTLNYRVRD